MHPSDGWPDHYASKTFGASPRIRGFATYFRILCRSSFVFKSGNTNDEVDHEVDIGVLPGQARPGRREPAPECRGLQRIAGKGAGGAALRRVPVAGRYLRASPLAGGRRPAVV